VVGNGAYVHAPALPNPRNDAEAMAATLRQLGFEVELGVDLDKARMSDVFRRFGREVDGADVGLFFSAGHGLQVRGRNYLVPVDAQLEHEADVDWEGVPLDDVLRQVERGARLSLIFLDACRDNPLARGLARNMGRTRSAAVGSGLARVDAGLGTLIAFATAPDEVALDGQGRHSPFTAALLDHMPTPALEVEQMLKRVTASVAASTDGRQLPWRNSSLTEEFYFLPGASPAGRVVTAALAPTDPAAMPELDSETKYWRSIQGTTNPRDLEAYLVAYPEGRFAALARDQLAALKRRQLAALAPEPSTVRPEPRESAPQRVESAAALPIAPDASRVALPRSRVVQQVRPERLAALSAGARYTAEVREWGGYNDRLAHAFPRWRDVSAGRSRIAFGGATGGRVAPSLVREASGHDVGAQLAVFLPDDGLAVVQHSRLDMPTHRWQDVSARPPAASNWDYLRGQGGREEGDGSLRLGGLAFRYVLAETGDGRGCVVFSSARERDRLDGFLCGAPGARLTEAGVARLLGRIAVDGVIG
ncbi:MAG TPA: caspase family protein, partial [Geminicoccaceae bacterium]|nr:caspase family protein [Geminicoccaceae bacterium]